VVYTLLARTRDVAKLAEIEAAEAATH
jgi:hypothetical protein